MLINFCSLFDPRNTFLMVDSYTMYECLECSCCLVYYQESQLSLVVTLWLSGIVIDQPFALGGVDVSVHTYSLIIDA